ncbi:MAG: MBL fold metallo-hydrolase [Oscillospiraceae bacterium]|nr:MBL fold metallo-hydrolase [Oscillospiraceae bacterium]
MKITVLLENEACRPGIRCEHGLSMHVATARHSVLFDMGPNAMFLENAEALGVDVKAVDIAFLSHSHDDHCGGLELFCRRNERANVYLQKRAWGEYYVVTPRKCRYLGLDRALRRYETRFCYTEGVTVLDEELTVFSGGMGRDYWSHANDSLREKQGEDYPPDRFLHEQNLLVSENGKTALLAACAHNGIVNILRRAEEILGRAPDAVLAGFHLYSPSLGRTEPRALVEQIARELAARPGTRYYTGHCTGTEAYGMLAETLGERLQPMHGGSVITL